MRDLLVTGNERYFPSYKGRSHYLEKPSVVRAAARFDIVVKHLLHKNLLLAGGKSKTDSHKKLRQLGYFGFPRPLYDSNGVIIAHSNDDSLSLQVASTQWKIDSHNATTYGTQLNQKILPDRKFPYPKSIYAVEDVLRFFVADKPDALIVDFFAGSGTTAHATMLLNHLDGGHRRSISITNNEIGNQDEISFTQKGLRPSDNEWRQYGIANYITWPRIKAAITGISTVGEPIKGDYKFTEDFPMSDGFQENAVFCELTYESEWPIRLDRAFNAIAPILWMQAGCKGQIIRKIGKCFLTTSQYGVLFDFNQLSKFCEQVKKKNLKTVFVVTDDQRRYSNVCRRLPGVKVHRLYETYLRTFEIWGEGALDE